VIAGAQSCFPLLAAEPLPVRRSLGEGGSAARERGALASATLTSASKTRARNFCARPSGRLSRRRRVRSMFTPGSRACGYRTASGRGKWPNRDPLGELGGLNLYGFTDNNPLNRVDIDGRVAPVIVVGGISIGALEAAAAAFGISAIACLSTPACRDAAMRLTQEALEEAAEAAKEAIRRCMPCSRRHPTWPRCSGPSDPVSAVLRGAQGLYPGWSPYSAEIRDVRPADAAACPSGGEWYTIKTEFFAMIQTGTIYHTMPISVVCCNCCGRWLEGKSCRIIHPGRGSGGAPPPPSQPPFPGPR